LTGDEQVDKRSELVIRMKEWVDQEYEDGRQTCLTNEELESKITEFSGGQLRRA